MTPNELHNAAERLSAIDIHNMATDACHEYWRLAERRGEQKSMPDVIADAFGDMILVRQQRIEELEQQVAHFLDLDTQCKIAFAEMHSAWFGAMYSGKADAMESARLCQAKFLTGERTPELLADMQCVTRELRGRE